MNEHTYTNFEMYDDATTRFNFMMAKEDGITLAHFIMGSIEAMLPYMDAPGSDYFII